MKKANHVFNSEALSVARVNVSDSTEQPVYISLGAGAVMGSYFTVKEAKALVVALNKTIKELS
jgi:hypothetical protein